MTMTEKTGLMMLIAATVETSSGLARAVMFILGWTLFALGGEPESKRPPANDETEGRISRTGDYDAPTE